MATEPGSLPRRDTRRCTAPTRRRQTGNLCPESTSRRRERCPPALAGNASTPPPTRERRGDAAHLIHRAIPRATRSAKRIHNLHPLLMSTPPSPCVLARDTDLQAWEPGADPTLGVQHSRAHGANYEPPSSTAPSGTVTSKLGSCTLSPYCSPAKSNRFQSPACDSIAIRRITPRVSGARLT